VKKSLLSILLIILGSVTFAQKQKVNYLTTFDEKRIHFGFTLGYNYLDFAVTNYNPIGDNPDYDESVIYKPSGPGANESVRSDVQTLIPGFTVAIVSNLRLTEDLDLRFLPGMSFGERKLTYNVPIYDINVPNATIESYSIKSTFLDFPLLIKYKARRINNDRPYVIFGSAFRQDISKTAKEDLVKLKGPGFYAEVGGGWDHYFPFFRLSVEGKFSFGLNNQLGPAPAEVQRQYYSQSIKTLRSNIFTLSLHFE
jgi:hypothetical protein